MPADIVTVVSSLVSAVIGGGITFVGTVYLKTREWRREQLRRDIDRRIELYSEFIGKCSQIMAVFPTGEGVPGATISRLASLTAQVRLLASPDVFKQADGLANGVKNIYAGQPTSSYGMLILFSEAAQREFEQMKIEATRDWLDQIGCGKN